MTEITRKNDSPLNTSLFFKRTRLDFERNQFCSTKFRSFFIISIRQWNLFAEQLDASEPTANIDYHWGCLRKTGRDNEKYISPYALVFKYVLRNQGK